MEVETEPAFVHPQHGQAGMPDGSAETHMTLLHTRVRDIRLGRISADARPSAHSDGPGPPRRYHVKKLPEIR